MQTLDREKAFEIMQLSPDATSDEISKRYGILTRKFRTIERDENGYTLEDITKAYELLMGYTYKDDKEELRQKKLRENPPLIARILKKDPVKLENFFYYYRVYIIISIVAVVFLVFMIRSCVNQVKYDFCVVVFGKVFAEDEKKIETYIKEQMPSTPGVVLLPSYEADPQYEYAVQMKLIAMAAAKEIDVLITDEAVFKIQAKQGMFMALDDIADILGFSDDRYIKGEDIIDESDEGETEIEPDKIYGIKISDSEFVKENGIIGENITAGIVTNTEKKDKAIEFMKLLK
ncbi:MAG: hypothetical protein GX494_05635 [Clostridiaceae bacterium]|nr:hypothetical protein [Clostridiaceae bacterium]